MNPTAGATATLLSDNAGAGPARHADRVGVGVGDCASAGAGMLIIFHDSDMEAMLKRWNKRARSDDMTVG